jgi:hypothetical protein
MREAGGFRGRGGLYMLLEEEKENKEGTGLVSVMLR